MKLPAHTKPWLQGAVGGAVLCAFVGFIWGGWETGSTARHEAMVASQSAVVSALAPICAERFRAQPDAASKVDAVAKASSWERGSIVERSGFALMPGSKTVDSDVARACGELLAKTPPPKA